MPTKRDLSDLVKFLELVGFWPYLGDRSNRIKRWFQIFRLVIFVKSVSLWILSAYIVGAADFLKKIYAGIVLCTPYMVIQTIFIFCNGHHLQSFVTTMANTIAKRNEPWQKEILNNLLNPLWKIIRISTFYSLLLLTVAFYGPILFDTLSTVFTSAEPLNLNVTIDGLLPSVKKGNFFYYFLQWYNAFLEGLGLAHFIGLVSILPLLVNYIRVEIKILCRKIDEYSRRGVAEQEALLREIIEDHINIMRLTELTNKFLAAPLILQNVAAAAAITLFTYAMTNSISQVPIRKIYKTFIKLERTIMKTTEQTDTD
ncbi:uncharacterized protein [Halyomorpha halys]|uniref:uncharacterized protein n=1 Tax=Halyomorpha halys TaxID=286706 RepID=UPI0034D3428C